ncbi:cysteine hydrolase family protein [Gracilibacillus salinarum]|uniref:Cysteine hydrolase n=1 Tax=Gracilibacillus salinarum TaxID=2932255 RepID=A0ABY4GKI8_9BACI|nr:isochorismatase family cysteine hydrolase [Gracilibacillus salinarum]UOQ84880.1 cysteine hydrolase [Gracilibacillus salinarum]
MSQQTALLAMDLQNNIISRYATDPEALLPFQQAIDAARRADIPVIFVRVAFRDHFLEVSEHNKMFGRLKQMDPTAGSNQGTEIHEAIAPEPGEAIVTKRRVSAFSGSDLEVLLRSMGIQHVILSGIATSGVVLSTLREAADKDYKLTVLSDACLDGDKEVHRVLTEKVFPMQAEVVTVSDWAAGIA